MSLDRVTWRPPTIETDRLVLRGWERTDAAAVFRYASDPDVARFMAWDQHRNPEASHSFLNAHVARAYAQRELEFAVCLRDSPTDVVGGVGAVWRSRLHSVMELGYVLARSHWGQGLAVEAGKAVMALAFSTTEVERIYAPIFASNDRSQRAAAKMGMTLDGVLRSSVCYRGQRRDESIYSLLRGEAGRLVG